MSKAIMLDMEFLDTKHTAAILSIGMVEMDLDKLTTGRTFELEVDADSCMHHGMTTSASTFKWWAEQDVSVIQRSFSKSGKYQHTLPLAMAKVANFISSVGSPDELTMIQVGDLDAQILTNGFKACHGRGFEMKDGNMPWHFYKVQCMRMLRDLYGNEVDVPPNKNKHSALADAQHQAYTLLGILALLRGKSSKPVKPAPVDDDEL